MKRPLSTIARTYLRPLIHTDVIGGTTPAVTTEVMVVVAPSTTVTVEVLTVKSVEVEGTATVTVSKNRTVLSGCCWVKVCVASLAA